MTPRRPHPRLSVTALLDSRVRGRLHGRLIGGRPEFRHAGPARIALGPALAAATLLVLTGCGATDAGAVSQGELPSSSATSPATSPASSEPASSDPAPSETASAEPAPTETTPTETAPPETASAEADPEPTETTAPRLLAYAGGESPGAEIHSQADADKLQGAPAAFKRFIGRTAERLADGSTCTDGYVGVTVEFLRTDGYAVGGVNECGGYRALWAVVDGSWTEVAASQEMWDCAVLDRYSVPSEIAGTHCYDYDAQEERDYAAS